MVRLKEKSRIKNWVEGDTFAVKIENVDLDFDGKYLILTYFNHPYCDNYKNNRYFHIKITDKKEIPTTEEEINRLESIITRVTLWNMRFYPFSALESLKEWEERTKGRTFIPDEFNYLNTYTAEIWIKRGVALINFEYLGNFNILSPANEFMSESVPLYFNETPKRTHNDFVIKLIKNYREYNLRESELYTKEGLKKAKKADKEALENVKWFEKKRMELRNKGIQ